MASQLTFIPGSQCQTAARSRAAASCEIGTRLLRSSDPSPFQPCPPANPGGQESVPPGDDDWGFDEVATPPPDEPQVPILDILFPVVDLRDLTRPVQTEDPSVVLAYLTSAATKNSTTIVMRHSDNVFLNEHDIWTLQTWDAWLENGTLNLWIQYLRQNLPERTVIAFCDLFPLVQLLLKKGKARQAGPSNRKQILSHMQGYNVRTGNPSSTRAALTSFSSTALTSFTFRSMKPGFIGFCCV